MSVKLKDKDGTLRTYDNVHAIKLKDENNNDVTFYKALHQKTIFLKTADEYYSAQENGSGVATTIPVEPTRAGFIFRGWSEVSHALIPANKVELPKVYNADTTLYAMWLETPTSGGTITGLGSQSTGNVTFVISQDFADFLDDIVNGDYDETDAYNNVFVKIPTVYRKVQTIEDGQITAIALSLTKLDDDYKPYPCFIKPDGVTVMPYVMIGKYCFTSSSEASSVSGTPVSLNMATARQLAQAKGTGYQLYDWQMQRLFQDLSLCYKKTVNVNQNPLLGIYHLDIGILVDGIARVNSKWLCAYDPSKYVNSPYYTNANDHTDGYSQIGYDAPTGSNKTIKKLGYDANNPFFNYPSELTGESGYATYYCDGYWYASGNYPIRSDVSISSAAYGLFYCISNNGWSDARCVRLCYRPIA